MKKTLIVRCEGCANLFWRFFDENGNEVESYYSMDGEGPRRESDDKSVGDYSQDIFNLLMAYADRALLGGTDEGTHEVHMNMDGYVTKVEYFDEDGEVIPYN